MAENITYCIYNKDAYDISNFDLNILVYSYANLKNDWVADPQMVLPYSKMLLYIRRRSRAYHREPNNKNDCR